MLGLDWPQVFVITSKVGVVDEGGGASHDFGNQVQGGDLLCMYFVPYGWNTTMQAIQLFLLFAHPKTCKSNAILLHFNFEDELLWNTFQVEMVFHIDMAGIWNALSARFPDGNNF
ncbi:hypothetical protein Tco_0961928 [Tanacetum coccineum]